METILKLFINGRDRYGLIFESLENLSECENVSSYTYMWYGDVQVELKKKYDDISFFMEQVDKFFDKELEETYKEYYTSGIIHLTTGVQNITDKEGNVVLTLEATFDTAFFTET